MNECCNHLYREAKRELEIKDKRIAFLETEVSRVFEPTRQYWNSVNEEKIKELEAKLAEANEQTEHVTDLMKEIEQNYFASKDKLAIAIGALKKLDVGCLEYGQIYDVIDEAFKAIGKE